MEEKQREQKRARTTRSDYLSDVDEVQAWVRQAEVKVQDRSAEPQALRDALRLVQSELGPITDKLERLTRNGRLIVENTRDDGEKELIEKTINDLSEQLAQVRSWLEEKKQIVGDTLDAWQRFLTLYEAVRAWTEEKRQFLVEPLKLSTLVQARQRLHEYSTAVKSCKQVNKNLSDMAKELDNIRQATSAGDLPEKFTEAEEAKIQVEGQLLERNALLQETSEEWEQCERKMKEVKSWMEKARQTLESPQNKKKPLRDQHAIREKMLSDVAIQKTKISISVEKLQVHFRSGIGGDKRVTEIAEELMSELDALYKTVKEETSSLEVCLAQIDQYQQEVQKLRQKVVQVEQQLRTVLSPTYLPNNREKAFQEQQNLQQRMDDWKQQMRILMNQIHAVDPYYTPSNEIKGADSPGRFTGQASYADIAAGRTSPASRGCSPYRNQQREEALPPPPVASSSASCPLAIQVLRQTVLQEQQYQDQQQISHFQRIQHPTQVESPQRDDANDVTSVEEEKNEVKKQLIESLSVPEKENSDNLCDLQQRAAVPTRRGRSPTRRLESTNRNLPAVRVQVIESSTSQSSVPQKIQKLESKAESSKDTLNLSRDDTRGRSASPIWVPGSTSYADILRGGSRGFSSTSATRSVAPVAKESRSGSPMDESIESNDSVNLPEPSSDHTTQETGQTLQNKEVEEATDEEQVKIVPSNASFIQQSQSAMMESSQQFIKEASTSWSDEIMEESYENPEHTQNIEETRRSYNYIHPPAMNELVGFIGRQLRAYPVGSYVYTPVDHHHHQQQISIGPYPSAQIAYTSHFVNQSDYLQSSNALPEETHVQEEPQNIAEVENVTALVADSHPIATVSSFSTESEQQIEEYAESMEETKESTSLQSNLENKSQVFSYAQILSQGLSPRVEVPVNVVIEKTQLEPMRERSDSPKIIPNQRESPRISQEKEIMEKVQKVQQGSQAKKTKESDWGTMKKKETKKKSEQRTTSDKGKQENKEKKMEKIEKAEKPKETPRKATPPKENIKESCKENVKKETKVEQEKQKEKEKEKTQEKKKEERNVEKVREKTIEQTKEKVEQIKEKLDKENDKKVEQRVSETTEKKRKQKKKKSDNRTNVDDEIDKALKEIEDMDKQRKQKEQAKSKKDTIESTINKLEVQKEQQHASFKVVEEESTGQSKTKVETKSKKKKEFKELKETKEDVSASKEEDKNIQKEKPTETTAVLESKKKNAKSQQVDKVNIKDANKAKECEENLKNTVEASVPVAEKEENMKLPQDRVTAKKQNLKPISKNKSKDQDKSKDQITSELPKVEIEKDVTTSVTTSVNRMEKEEEKKVTDEQNKEKGNKAMDQQNKQKEENKTMDEQSKQKETNKNYGKSKTTAVVGKEKEQDKEKEENITTNQQNKQKETSKNSEKLKTTIVGEKEKEQKTIDEQNKEKKESKTTDEQNKQKESNGKTEKLKITAIGKEEKEGDQQKVAKEEKAMKKEELQVIKEKTDQQEKDRRKEKEKKKSKDKQTSKTNKIEEQTAQWNIEFREKNSNVQDNVDKSKGASLLAKEIKLTKADEDKSNNCPETTENSESSDSTVNKSINEKSNLEAAATNRELERPEKEDVFDQKEKEKREEDKEEEKEEEKKGVEDAKDGLKLNQVGKAVIIEKTVTTVKTTVGSGTVEVKPPDVKSTKTVEILENVPLLRSVGSKISDVISLRPETVEASLTTTYARVSTDPIVNGEKKCSREKIPLKIPVGPTPEIVLSEIIQFDGEAPLFGSIKDRKKGRIDQSEKTKVDDSAAEGSTKNVKVIENEGKIKERSVDITKIQLVESEIAKSVAEKSKTIADTVENENKTDKIVEENLRKIAKDLSEMSVMSVKSEENNIKGANVLETSKVSENGAEFVDTAGKRKGIREQISENTSIIKENLSEKSDTVADTENSKTEAVSIEQKCCEKILPATTIKLEESNDLQEACENSDQSKQISCTEDAQIVSNHSQLLELVKPYWLNYHGYSQAEIDLCKSYKIVKVTEDVVTSPSSCVPVPRQESIIRIVQESVMKTKETKETSQETKANDQKFSLKEEQFEAESKNLMEEESKVPLQEVDIKILQVQEETTKEQTKKPVESKQLQISSKKAENVETKIAKHKNEERPKEFMKNMSEREFRLRALGEDIPKYPILDFYQHESQWIIARQKEILQTVTSSCEHSVPHQIPHEEVQLMDKKKETKVKEEQPKKETQIKEEEPKEETQIKEEQVEKEEQTVESKKDDKPLHLVADDSWMNILDETVIIEDTEDWQEDSIEPKKSVEIRAEGKVRTEEQKIQNIESNKKSDRIGKMEEKEQKEPKFATPVKLTDNKNELLKRKEEKIQIDDKKVEAFVSQTLNVEEVQHSCNKNEKTDTKTDEKHKSVHLASSEDWLDFLDEEIPIDTDDFEELVTKSDVNVKEREETARINERKEEENTAEKQKDDKLNEKVEETSKCKQPPTLVSPSPLEKREELKLKEEKEIEERRKPNSKQASIHMKNKEQTQSKTKSKKQSKLLKEESRIETAEKPKTEIKEESRTETEEKLRTKTKEEPEIDIKEKPVIEIKEELQTEIKEKPTIETKEEPKMEVKQESRTETKEKLRTKTKEELKTEIKEKSTTETKVEPKTEIKEKSTIETKEEPKTEIKEKTTIETKEEPKTQTKEKPKIEVKQESRTETKQKLRTKTKEELKTEIKEEPTTETRVEPKIEIKEKPTTETKVEPRTEIKEKPTTEIKVEPKSVIKEKSTIETKEEPKTQTKEKPKTEIKEKPKTEIKEKPTIEVKKEPKTETEEKLRTKTKKEPKTEVEEKTTIETKEEPKTEIKEKPTVETKEEPKTEMKEKPTVETKEEPKTETKQKPKMEVKKESRTETKEKRRTKTKEEPKTEIKDKSSTETKEELITETKEKSERPKTEVKKESRTETKEKLRTRTKEEPKASIKEKPTIETKVELKTTEDQIQAEETLEQRNSQSNVRSWASIVNTKNEEPKEKKNTEEEEINGQSQNESNVSKIVEEIIQIDEQTTQSSPKVSKQKKKIGLTDVEKKAASLMLIEAEKRTSGTTSPSNGESSIKKNGKLPGESRSTISPQGSVQDIKDKKASTEISLIAEESTNRDPGKSYAAVAASSCRSSPQLYQEQVPLEKPKVLRPEKAKEKLVFLSEQMDLEEKVQNTKEITEMCEISKKTSEDIKTTTWADEVEEEIPVQLATTEKIEVSNSIALEKEDIPKMQESSWASVVGKKALDTGDSPSKLSNPSPVKKKEHLEEQKAGKKEHPQIQILVEETPQPEPIESLVQVDEQGFMEFVNRKELRSRRSRSRSRDRFVEVEDFIQEEKEKVAISGATEKEENSQLIPECGKNSENEKQNIVLEQPKSDSVQIGNQDKSQKKQEQKQKGRGTKEQDQKKQKNLSKSKDRKPENERTKVAENLETNDKLKDDQEKQMITDKTELKQGDKKEEKKVQPKMELNIETKLLTQTDRPSESKSKKNKSKRNKSAKSESKPATEQNGHKEEKKVAVEEENQNLPQEEEKKVESEEQTNVEDNKKSAIDVEILPMERKEIETNAKKPRSKSKNKKVKVLPQIQQSATEPNLQISETEEERKKGEEVEIVETVIEIDPTKTVIEFEELVELQETNVDEKTDQKDQKDKGKTKKENKKKKKQASKIAARDIDDRISQNKTKESKKEDEKVQPSLDQLQNDGERIEIEIKNVEASKFTEEAIPDIDSVDTKVSQVEDQIQNIEDKNILLKSTPQEEVKEKIQLKKEQTEQVLNLEMKSIEAECSIKKIEEIQKEEIVSKKPKTDELVDLANEQKEKIPSSITHNESLDLKPVKIQEELTSQQISAKMDESILPVKPKKESKHEELSDSFSPKDKSQAIKIETTTKELDFSKETRKLLEKSPNNVEFNAIDNAAEDEPLDPNSVSENIEEVSDELPKSKVQFYIADDVLVVNRDPEKELKSALIQERTLTTVRSRFLSLDIHGFWPNKHPYHDAERDLFESLAVRSKNKTLLKEKESDWSDREDPDEEGDNGRGGGSGGNFNRFRQSDCRISPRTECLVTDLPGGICSWRDYSTYLSSENLENVSDPTVAPPSSNSSSPLHTSHAESSAKIDLTSQSDVCEGESASSMLSNPSVQSPAESARNLGRTKERSSQVCRPLEQVERETDAIEEEPLRIQRIKDTIEARLGILRSAISNLEATELPRDSIESMLSAISAMTTQLQNHEEEIIRLHETLQEIPVETSQPLKNSLQSVRSQVVALLAQTRQSQELLRQATDVQQRRSDEIRAYRLFLEETECWLLDITGRMNYPQFNEENLQERLMDRAKRVSDLESLPEVRDLARVLKGALLDTINRLQQKQQVSKVQQNSCTIVHCTATPIAVA